MVRNNRGTTLIEIVISIGLISIVVIFIMQLFVTSRSNYVNSKTKIEYEVLKSSIIKSVEEDMSLYEIDSLYDDCNNSIKIVYDGYRDNDYKKEKKIIKVLKTYVENNKSYISYEFDPTIDDLTTEEKALKFAREIKDAGSLSLKSEVNDKYVKIKVPLLDNRNNSYDIIIYGRGKDLGFYSKAC